MQNHLKNNFFILVLLTLLSCLNNKESNNSEINALSPSKTDLVYYSNGSLKSKTTLKKLIKHGQHLEFYKNGDTLKNCLYTNDSLVYCLQYDSLGNKTDDFRKIYYHLNQSKYFTNDSIIISYYIKGPLRENIFMRGGTYQFFPDTNVVIGKNIDCTGCEYEQYIIIAKSPGKYNIQIACTDIELLKIVGHIELIIEVLE